VRAAYVQAAEVFLEGYQADPKGSKAPDSLLKLGMSLSGLDKKREACAAFDKVAKDFPGASAGIRNTIAREKQKNSCP
jgi:TolA-binding protein